MNLQLIQLFFLVIVVCLSLLLGFGVLSADKKSRTNKFYFLTSLAISFWVLSSYFTYYDPLSSHSLIFARINFCAVMFFAISMFGFIKNFPKVNNFSKPGIIFIFSGILISIFSLFSPQIIQNITVDGSLRTWHFGSFINVYYVFAIVAAFLPITSLLLKQKTFGSDEKIKIKFLLIGISLVAIFNIVFNIIVPIVLPNLNIYWLGDYSLIFFLGFTAYAITKHHLFNIKLIATESIVIFLSMALLVEMFLSSNVTEIVLKGIIWIIASYGGIILIKSVKVEIKQREDLAKLAKELENANQHLKDIDKLKDDFLSMASHELNTPIAAIEGYLSMILQEGMGGKIPDKAREYLETVFASSQRLANLVKDLLNVSRIESGRIHIIYEQKQIGEIIDQAMMEVASKAREAKHTMTFEKPKKAMPATWFDVTRVTEILINMLGNSIKYTPDGGKIVVRAVADDQKIVVSVEDNGKGIPKGRGEGVFDKFTQVDVMKDEVKGTGLGMYIAKKFIELMNGKIWFQSAGEGKGTTFYFSLPVLKQKPADPHEGEGAVLH